LGQRAIIGVCDLVCLRSRVRIDYHTPSRCCHRKEGSALTAWRRHDTLASPATNEAAKDYERTAQTSETLIELAASRLLLRRLARHRPNHREPHEDPVAAGHLLA
jgi:hypothetical protein